MRKKEDHSQKVNPNQGQHQAQSCESNRLCCSDCVWDSRVFHRLVEQGDERETGGCLTQLLGTALDRSAAFQLFDPRLHHYSVEGSEENGEEEDADEQHDEPRRVPSWEPLKHHQAKHHHDHQRWS